MEEHDGVNTSLRVKHFLSLFFILTKQITFIQGPDVFIRQDTLYTVAKG